MRIRTAEINVFRAGHGRLIRFLEIGATFYTVTLLQKYRRIHADTTRAA